MAEYINLKRARFEAERYFKDMCEIQDEVDFFLCTLPTADVQEVRHAKFELVQNGKGVCSNCHRLDSIDDLAKYCRYCGAYIVESATDTNVGSRKEQE